MPPLSRSRCKGSMLSTGLVLVFGVITFILVAPRDDDHEDDLKLHWRERWMNATVVGVATIVLVILSLTEHHR